MMMMEDGIDGRAGYGGNFCRSARTEENYIDLGISVALVEILITL